jgi:hypothetical protein
MARHGQIHVYGGQASKTQWDIIDKEDYKLRVKKDWVEATNVWHVQIISQSIFDRRFEMFLTHEELKMLKDIL